MKKLCSLLRTEEDIDARKRLATLTMNKLVLFGKAILIYLPKSESIKVMLCQSFFMAAVLGQTQKLLETKSMLFNER